MATDSFAGMQTLLSDPCAYAEAVTPSDTVDLTITSRALYVGGGGAISVLTAKGQTVTFSGVVTGTILPIRVARVNSTSTTATSILALA